MGRGGQGSRRWLLAALVLSASLATWWALEEGESPTVPDDTATASDEEPPRGPTLVSTPRTAPAQDVDRALVVETRLDGRPTPADLVVESLGQDLA